MEKDDQADILTGKGSKAFRQARLFSVFPHTKGIMMKKRISTAKPGIDESNDDISFDRNQESTSI